MNDINGKVSGTFKIAYASYEGSESKRLRLFVTDQEEFFQAGNKLQDTKISGMNGQWAEYPVVSFANNNPTTTIGHLLKWRDKGIVHILSNDTGELTLDEMLKVAESVKYN